MKLILITIGILLFSNVSLADQALIDVAKESEALQASFIQCGFCPSKRVEFEKFKEAKLIPELERVGKAIQKKPSAKSSRVLFEIALANKDSASESFSYALGDVYLANKKTFKNLLEEVGNPATKIIVLDKTEWGIQNHKKLSKKKMKQILKELEKMKKALD